MRGASVSLFWFWFALLISSLQSACSGGIPFSRTHVVKNRTLTAANRTLTAENRQSKANIKQAIKTKNTALSNTTRGILSLQPCLTSPLTQTEEALLIIASQNVTRIEATINIWEPHTVPGFATRAFLRLSEHNTGNVIEAGIQVAPDCFPHEPRIYVSYTNNGQSCVQPRCKGFIQDRSGGTYNIGSAIQPSSRYNNPNQKELKFAIQQVAKGWQLQCWTKDGKTVNIGHWPFKLFGRDIRLAFFGGDVLKFGNQKRPEPPIEMGSGHFASEGWGKASYIKDVRVTSTQIVGKSSRVTSPPCYSYNEKSSPKFGPYMFYYGGPGCK